jgi:hypothetical protein
MYRNITAEYYAAFSQQPYDYCTKEDAVKTPTRILCITTGQSTSIREYKK